MATRVKTRRATWSRSGQLKSKHSSDSKAEAESTEVTVSKHEFSAQEILSFRNSLLGWYDENKRELQWRVLAKHSDKNVGAYSVLVSEIMLQQTQVSTVKPYYAKWIEKWPDVQSLSRATLEEVHTAWAGLGYYSRGRRLHEAACKIVNDMSGNIPDNAKDLEKQLPGVGRYTASAVASIAFNEAVGLVDGNVVRVLTRMRRIGSDTSAQSTMDFLWKLSHALVDPRRPGDFNQAVMELGATVCTPKTPNCGKCPVVNLCQSYGRVNGLDAEDIEDIGCSLCPPADDPWNDELGVMNYPRKGRKTKARDARSVVGIVSRTSQTGRLEYLLWQRPKSGLLASLWEFPSFAETGDAKLENHVDFGSSETLPGKYVGEVFHQFSHISQTYSIYRYDAGIDREVSVRVPDGYQGFRWMTESEIQSSAVSTAMKKVFRILNVNRTDKRANKLDERETLETNGKKQKTMKDFFAKRK